MLKIADHVTRALRRHDGLTEASYQRNKSRTILALLSRAQTRQ